MSEGIIQGFLSLLKGMRLTLHYLTHPSTVVTQQYPENRATLKLPDRYRSRLTMPHDENGFHKCTACHICEESCPNGSIIIAERGKPVTARRELDTFTWRLDSCTFCNVCVVVCPFQALKMEGHFEQAVFDRRLLSYALNRYAGGTTQALMKIAEPADRQAAIEPRLPYSGAAPLARFAPPPEPRPGPAAPAQKVEEKSGVE